jgi:serine/threonine-protein kinase/endoribonuclease IRE1
LLSTDRWLVMELCQTNLCEWIKNPPNCGKHLDAQVINGQLVIGLSYLHDKNIVHRDLKPQNVLVSVVSEGIVLLKLADFGASKQARNKPNGNIEVSDSQSGRGTSGFMAPEVLETERGSPIFASDVWSLGVVMFFVLSRGGHPFGEKIYEGGRNVRDFIIKSVKNLRKVGPISHDWAATDLIIRLLQYEAQDRPSAFLILCHPYFTLRDQ